jgi:hypothetical protein
MNLFLLLGDGEKKMTETLYHALRAMMQFRVIFFFRWYSITKQKNNFIP